MKAMKATMKDGDVDEGKARNKAGYGTLGQPMAIREMEAVDRIAEMFQLGAWEWDIPSRRLEFNDSFLEMLGYTRNEMKGTVQDLPIITHPEDYERLYKAMHDYVDGKRDSFSHRTRVLHKQGHYIWMQDTARIVEWDEDGAPFRVLGGLMDIDDLVQAEKNAAELLRAKEEYSENLRSEVRFATKELRKNQEVMDSMLESSPYINVIFDESFKPIYCNSAAVEFYGYRSKEEFLDNIMEDVHQFIPERQENGRRSVSLATRLTYVKEHGHCEFEARFVVGGKSVYMQNALKRIPYGNGFAILVYQMNVQFLKETEKTLVKQEKLLKVINFVASRLIDARPETFKRTVDDSLRAIGQTIEVDHIRMWENYEEEGEPKCRLAYEWSEDAATKGDAETSLRYHDTSFWYKTLSSGKSVNSLVKDLPKQERHKMRDVKSILSIPVFTHKEYRGFICFCDCQEERTFTDAEEQMLSSATILIESAILRNEMTEGLILAKEEALDSAKVKSEFLSRMSHEIRTPMNAIIGMNAVAKKSDDALQIHAFLNKIDVASRQLLGVINDVLDMSKIEAKKLVLNAESFDFDCMLQNVIDIAMVKIGERNQNFRLEYDKRFDRVVVGDELRLSQVLTNLLSNASKFTMEGGMITLRVSYEMEGENEVRLHMEVEDDGIGISKEKREKLFRSFEQADGGITRKYGGTGLGLAISKNIVGLMGGDMWVESEPNEGSCFQLEVVVPLGEAVRPDDDCLKAEEGKTYDWSGKNILLVEDIEINREIVLYMLKDTKANVWSACDGEEAVRMFRERGGAYDLIIMDVQMPVMDGLTATREIRAMDVSGADGVPIIAMTANVFKEDVEQCIQAGMNDHVAKPVEANELMGRMSKWFARAV